MTTKPYHLEVNDDTLIVGGEIYFDNVVAAMELGLQYMQPKDSIKIDLSGLKHCDSSSLALCSAWVRARRRQKKEIVFIHLPPFMYDLIRVHGLDLVLPLGRTDGKINYHGR